MIVQTLIPTAADLVPLLAEATHKKSAEAFVAAYLKGLATILKTDPRQYRSYGPFWWPLKALLVETYTSMFDGLLG